MLPVDYQQIECEKFTRGYECPHCKGVHIIRNGHRKRDKVQVYKCKDCGRTFVVTTESIFSKTHKARATWTQYILCMVEGKSLRKSAEDCGISLRTAFMWRHKILDVISEEENNIKLDGLVEAMEMYFSVSYKGKRNLSRKEKNDDRLVCVPCAVNRDNKAISKVSGINSLKTNELAKILQRRISNSSKLITSRKQVFSRFARQEKLEIIKIKDNKIKKGIYHNQTAEIYKNNFNRFMVKFKGVATKYLNNYLVWYNFMNFSKRVKEELPAKIIKNLITINKTITYKNLPLRNKIPLPN